MLLILPNLPCYSYFPVYHATYPSQLITLLVLPNLSRYSFFQLIMLLILPNLSRYSSLPLYHATHTSQLIMLLIFPNLSCYLSFSIYHATYPSNLSCCSSFHLYQSTHSPTKLYINDVQLKTPLNVSKNNASHNQPTNHQTRPRRHVSAQIKPSIARNKLTIRNRMVQDNELNISTPFL